MTFRVGERVRITYNGETAEGEVFMIASNGLSLTLTFDKYLGGYMKLMPVLWNNDQYVDLLLGETVEIRPICRVLHWPEAAHSASL
ncbi:MAG TPA: hypothetical protein VNW97_02240 [Candidatus Saccharimonadales bacterium]|jgi:hypothetical protein|nr:hypothetical protein [Candidatus Saccharimonadales bacterium]